ncbi:MAG TPA: sensor histidine kinase [Bacteroidia bacterium]|nr:sensor histidine kinase [Bacteroidia bacterium]
MIRAFLDKIVNIGVKPGLQTWEVYLIRKLNAITIIALLNNIIGVVFFSLIGLPQFNLECITVLVIGPFVFVFNKYKNVIWAVYWFYIVGYIYLTAFNLHMGKDSFILLFFFPVIISMVQLLGRRELLKHLIILSSLVVVCAVVIVFSYRYHWFESPLSKETIQDLSIFMIILSFITAIAFIIVVVTESMSQERLIKNMLNEKEVLLAEVYHRVKNNMNIVTSLLNLKKDMSSSKEVQEALDDCRNRVYSMALVHQKMYNSNNLESLNFKDYINDLVKDIKHSLGGTKKLNVAIDAENINLELSNAIPCGLILNELITNAYKHAGSHEAAIQVSIELKKNGNSINLVVRDNGPGITNEALNKPNALGIELIKSLTEQLEGKYEFANRNGLVFSLSFNQA